MAQNVVRKKCRVTAESLTTKTLTPYTGTTLGSGPSPAVPITSFLVTMPSINDFWSGSGRYEFIIRRM